MRSSFACAAVVCAGCLQNPSAPFVEARDIASADVVAMAMPRPESVLP